MSGRRHARRAKPELKLRALVDVARALSREAGYVLAVILAFLCACAGGLFGGLTLSFLFAQPNIALACLSALATVISVVACRPALLLNARRADPRNDIERC